MPEQPPKRRTTIWFLSSAAQNGQLLWVDCGYCHDRFGRRYYDPGDLMKLFGDVDVSGLSRAMKCERCGRKDNIECDVIVPVAAERERIRAWGAFRVRAVELFAGAGGMSLGLKQAGFDVVAAYDSWQEAVDIYRANLGGYVRQADLKDIFQIAPAIIAQRPDLIAGGPPCQDFSAAGERVEGERAGLTRAFAMLVCIVRPKWFLMENVPLAARSQAWADARAMLMKAGYGLTESKLNASLYGVPQDRKRLFVIGRLGEADGFLESALAAARSPQPMTVRDMLGDALGIAFYVHPRMPGKRGIWSTEEPAPTMRGSIPDLQGRFGQWLRLRRGFSKQAVRNCRSRINRARRLLGGRTFADAAAELAALDALEGYAALPTGTRSDLRAALRLYREWQAQPKERGRSEAAKVLAPVGAKAVAA